MSAKFWPDWLPIRPDLEGLSPYGAPQIDVPVRLNTNENPFPLTEDLQNAVSESMAVTLRELNRYPDRDAYTLRSALAQFINHKSGTHFESDSIWVANGSNEILQSIFLAFAGSALGFEPSYSMHPLIARVIGKDWIKIERDDKFQISKREINLALAHSDVKLFFITTPNNPTGTTTSLELIAELATGAMDRGALVVVDEAYAEFSAEPSAVTLISKHPNLLVSRTMSKAFAFAGGRLGYLIADPKIIQAMQLVRLPYHLSSLTQAAALAALSRAATLESDVIQIRRDREQLTAELIRLGLTVIPSDANFLLFGGFTTTPEIIWKGLLDRGVLVRDVGISGYLRVTIGSPAENKEFLAALGEVNRR